MKTQKRAEAATPAAVTACADTSNARCLGTANKGSDPLSAFSAIDRALHAALGRWTHGISPVVLGRAWSDWLVHLSLSPGRQAGLAHEILRDSLNLWLRAARTTREPDQPPLISPRPHDRRFDDGRWQNPPFCLFAQSFLLAERWWDHGTTGLAGFPRHEQRVLDFVRRQLLDLIAPSNFVLTNPELLEATIEQRGANLRRGALHLLEDWRRALAGEAPVGAEQHVVGETLAVTPGAVVFRNELMELIQYAPTTSAVVHEPILIVPAWIMKYYILDLSPHNSLVRYLIGRGHTVFMISWKNPTAKDRDVSMDAYRALGIMTALDIINKILPGRQVHATGYCLGGTLLAIAAAAMARDQDHGLASITLLAAQTDFTEAGEIMLFLDETEIALLEDMMWDQGYLDKSQMSGAFQLLRSRDLIWSRIVHDYLLGQRQDLNDLMAWSADGTRLPYRMHAQYLRCLFLDNDLAQGRYQVDKRPVIISDIRAPMFAVGTVTDHVAPWTSVYKLHLQSDTQITFVLTSGGHNAGIVSEPGHPGRSYQIATKEEGDLHVDALTWQERTPIIDGSWWPAWVEWLKARSSSEGEPPPIGASKHGILPLGDAPGTYVRQR